MGNRIISRTIDLTNRGPDIVDKYITEITANNGIRIHPANTENDSIIINSNGMEVYKGGISVALYGDSARIGKAASNHISIDTINGIQIFTGTESDSTNIAQFGSSIRIGTKNEARFLVDATSLQAYDSSNSKYFEITNSGMSGNLITAGKISSASGDVYFDLDNNELACSSLVGRTTAANMGGYTYGSTYYGYFRIYNSSRGTYGLYIEPNGSAGDVWMSADNRLILESASVGTKDYSATKIEIKKGSIAMPTYNGSTFVASIEFGYGIAGSELVQINGSTRVTGKFTATGTKSRVVDTKTYDSRLLYCYETPTPLFGDIGEAIIDEDGLCYVDIDDIFSETVAENVEYQVFLQKEGQGDCWIVDKQKQYFIIEGTPKLKVAWELKTKQKDYQNIRLERDDMELDEYEYADSTMFTLEDFINEQEDSLYGNY